MRLLRPNLLNHYPQVDCGFAQPTSRRGAAALETAVSLPLLLILVFGSLELANAVFMKQSLNMAAYEAARVVTRPGNHRTLAQTRCQEIMNIRKVTNYTLTFSPPVPELALRGAEITVTVQAPASNLSYGPMRFMTGKTVTAVVRMVRL